ncbi:MAG TPA: hypothetical protein VN667_09830, partial [Burkholderiales bacterium]|nr:hypothetical protein [Burkholderiales bacterium]
VSFAEEPPLFCVWATGPDEYFPASSHQAATKLAEDMAAAYGRDKEKANSENFPECRFVVTLWPHRPSEHALALREGEGLACVRNSDDPRATARAIVERMGADNAAVFAPTLRQWNKLQDALERMRMDGCQFTEEDIDELAAGEETERDERFKRFDGFTEAHTVLNEIFEGDSASLVEESMAGLNLILAERRRQVFEEGFDPAHDDEHDQHELAYAACAYAAPRPLYTIMDAANGFEIDDCYPSQWDSRWDKRPRDEDGKLLHASDVDIEERLRNVVKAGALLAAEIDRLLRLQGTMLRLEIKSSEGPDKGERWSEARDNERAANRLLLVGFEVPEETIAAWTNEQWILATEYALAAHFNASDNEDVIVPPVPDFLHDFEERGPRILLP